MCSWKKRKRPEINSLAAVKPELAEEWSPKNPEGPELVWPRFIKMAWWVCRKCGFEWQAVINSRFRGQKCPACADRKLYAPYNSLAQREPWVLKEWNYEKNGDLLPMRILHNSMRPVWWKDEKGHQWRAKISDRLLRNWENAKNWLCINAGIRLVRILRPKDEEYDNCICITREDDSTEASNFTINAALHFLG